ncbi:hypothetical protein GCM10007877_15220 [Marinibactrum halimedae]|uniref:Uncharacterized protein n=1 Tax=Marinibactrum halimedae TaxID=1444977 RepID=A0AA37T3E6_9GAMM|nr:hypothetical protein GCM10007877_15220 [Marinibactrum halimedae]
MAIRLYFWIKYLHSLDPIVFVIILRQAQPQIFVIKISIIGDINQNHVPINNFTHPMDIRRRIVVVIQSETSFSKQQFVQCSSLKPFADDEDQSILTDFISVNNDEKSAKLPQ